PRLLGGIGLGGADVESAIDQRRVDADHFGIEALRPVQGARGLARRGRPHQGGGSRAPVGRRAPPPRQYPAAPRGARTAPCVRPMSCAGSRPSRLTATIARVATMKPGTISYSWKPIPSTAICFQAITTTAPLTMPASAPLRVIRPQNSDSTSTGPNAAPKPAQA